MASARQPRQTLAVPVIPLSEARTALNLQIRRAALVAAVTAHVCGRRPKTQLAFAILSGKAAIVRKWRTPPARTTVLGTAAASMTLVFATTCTKEEVARLLRPTL